jgi:hypothetical protein
MHDTVLVRKWNIFSKKSIYTGRIISILTRLDGLVLLCFLRLEELLIISVSHRSKLFSA